MEILRRACRVPLFIALSWCLLMLYGSHFVNGESERLKYDLFLINPTSVFFNKAYILLLLIINNNLTIYICNYRRGIKDAVSKDSSGYSPGRDGKVQALTTRVNNFIKTCTTILGLKNI